ncbi:PREDICTED: dymeclin isoform X1 [Wasmannia auropunctata]|uniref:dymeclin isoform X1 n=1 Tax=Wasmannia auropunctata TaxID=64793 RepID=UPI0005EF7636|nr:PREDICTED: dymeclin isoform X1 [Wasmannia auropunctata]XP_011698060.1 PREDICTED: dymeclin isoform X1 [Wasmannia auropunctata]XP_011698061.1 PREDICTED: dymeclin isoform X1 [Wasmannia auropunctata]
MGATPSRYEDLSKNVHLGRFCGKQSIPANDPFWSTFLSYNVRPPITRNDQIELDSRLDSSCQQLLVNNLVTGNFGTLIQIALIRINELLAPVQNQNIISAWQTYNALFAVRCILKYLIEIVGEEQMLNHIEAPQSASEALPTYRLAYFIEALIELITDVPLCEFTYVVHLEAINCLLVLLSVQLFSQTAAEYSSIYRIAMHAHLNQHAPVMVCTLLHNFIQQEHAPPGLLTQQSGGSIVFSIAAGLWNVIRMGIGSSSKNIQVTHNGTAEDEEKKRDTETPLASQSLLLLLVLTNHCTATQNPYRNALFSFVDMQEDVTVSQGKADTFKFNLNKLYNTICKIPNTDEVTLLLYMLLHRNSSVKQDIMRRPDIQLLVTPILQILYHAPNNTSHHIYMSLIILLILSEDETFNKRIHEIMLKGVTWYTERSISEISLGGLLILVVIRTIQYNMFKMRDKYLHTNCLAALANMSAQFTSLHPYVSQRLLSLFETLAKKHARLEARILEMTQSTTLSPKNSLVDTAINTTINVTIDADTGKCNASAVNTVSHQELIQDLTILEEVLRMVLEIINSCLTHRIAHNPNLIYTLLYKKDVFQPFRTHSAFQDIVQNIDSVINFFSYKLEQKDQSQLGVSQVLATIRQGTSEWPRDRLRKFPELKFKYVEEEQPEEFFIPYVWSVVCQGALLHWNAENIKLFSPNNSEATIIVC